MQKMRLVTFLFVLVALAFSISVAAQKAGKQKGEKQKGGRPLTAKLTGAVEVPGPGDADGSGSATFRFNPGQGEVCYELTVQNIAEATAAHIHEGAAGKSGGVKVPLDAPTTGSSKGCAKVDEALMKEIMQNPSNKYVNVNNAEFKACSVRVKLTN